MAIRNPNDPYNDVKQDRTLGIIFRIAGVFVALFLLAHLFFIKEDCTNGEFMYCHAHPTTAADILGAIIMVAGILFLVTGGKPLVKNDLYFEKGKGVAVAIGTLLAIAGGLALIYLL